MKQTNEDAEPWREGLDRPRYWMLDENRSPVACSGVLDWAEWFEGSDRIVAKTHVGQALVSTVFLGLDHSFGDGPPVLFETMIFGGPLDGTQERCGRWRQAEQMHRRLVDEAKQATAGTTKRLFWRIRAVLRRVRAYLWITHR